MTVAAGPSRNTVQSRAGAHVDVGLAPAQLWASQLHRSWDGALAASYEYRAHNVWGASLAAGPILHPWGTSPYRNESNRVLSQLVARWTTEGVGAAARLTLERARYFRGVLSDPGSLVGGAGESAIGLYVEAGYQTSDVIGDGWQLSLGLAVRIPALAGLTCCAH